jgi:hypothetical protein
MVVLIHGCMMLCKKQHSPLKSNYLENYFGANAVIARIFLVNIVKSTIINPAFWDRIKEWELDLLLRFTGFQLPRDLIRCPCEEE